MNPLITQAGRCVNVVDLRQTDESLTEEGRAMRAVLSESRNFGLLDETLLHI